MLTNDGKKYKITIKTTYNVITLYVDDYETPQMQEIFEQPYVLDIQIEELSKNQRLVKVKKV